jgi:lipopolysaccharide export system protein LptA
MRELLLLLMVATPALAAPPAKTAPLDVQAERLELRQQDGVALFEGNVVVTQEDLELRCARLTARYRKDGEIAELVAAGGVRVTRGTLKARAATATYRRAADTLTLTGDPQVDRGADRLRGKRIIFHLEARRMVVEQARGRLKAPRIADLDPGTPK